MNVSPVKGNLSVYSYRPVFATRHPPQGVPFGAADDEWGLPAPLPQGRMFTVSASNIYYPMMIWQYLFPHCDNSMSQLVKKSKIGWA